LNSLVSGGFIVTAFTNSVVEGINPTLAIRRVGLQTYGEYVAFLSASCRAYTPESFVNINKIEVRGTNGRTVVATLNIVENGDMLDPESLGLSSNAFKALGVVEGSKVTINLARPPRSMDFVRGKVRGESLRAGEIAEIISDIAAHRYSKTEITAFLVASAAFLTSDEVLALTKAMADVGTRINWTKPPCNFVNVMDKHCVGGIPGNRTSMIVVPIIAACGLPIPKTSSRAITSPAGTADTMEVFANVDVDLTRMQEIVERHKGCLVWGGHVNLSPADDVLISVERPLGIDTPEQMVASILSKKAAAGSTHLLIDIPVGPTAKVRSGREAARLSKLFQFVGRAMGIEVDVIMTDGTQPIGNGIGPALEARDIMAVLRNEPSAPNDLRERALQLAGSILEFDPSLKGGAGLPLARQKLENGDAFVKMRNIMEAQGPAPTAVAVGGKIQEVVAVRGGVVAAIDCARIGRIARLAGAPTSKGAGVDLLKKVGDPVKTGEPLYRIHAVVDSDFMFATEMAHDAPGYDVH
jgi:thymidine phosphorylase